LATTHNNLGNVLLGVGERTEAKQQFQKALTILENLIAEFPNASEYHWILAGSHFNLGNLQFSLRQQAEAKEQFQKAITISEKLVAEFPSRPEYRVLLGVVAAISVSWSTTRVNQPRV
jgi:tetratricopeptide (TPR) repeat protein